MTTRRFMMFSLAGALGWSSRAFASPSDDMPKATMIKGKPPVLDFGDGLKIPLDRSAFLTLWEGKSFWLTYGAGREPSSLAANGEAVKFASAAMQLLLLTLAFAPERLDHVDNCGWRLKAQDPRNYVVGKIDLPGKPYFRSPMPRSASAVPTIRAWSTRRRPHRASRRRCGIRRRAFPAKWTPSRPISC